MAGLALADKATGKFIGFSDRISADLNILSLKTLPTNPNSFWDGEKWNIVSKTVIEPIPEAPPEEQLELGILKLDDLNRLAISNSSFDADVRYRGSIPPIQGDGGIYLNSGSGFLAFPRLKSDRENATVDYSIIFNFDGRSSFLLGLASEENFNWGSNDRYRCEFCAYFRGNRLYYWYGGMSDRLYTYDGIVSLARNKTFRVDIVENGDRLQIWQLASSNYSDWFGGKLQMDEIVPHNIRGYGKTIMPIVIGANRVGNRIRGILKR